MSAGNDVFYLKVNLDFPFAIRCLQYWLDVISIYRGGVVIVCDKPALKKTILDRCRFKNGLNFIESEISEQKHYVENIYSPRWYNAAYAHLTTFYHADKTDVQKYWNIDADDTQFCLPPEKTAEVLKNVENYAEKNSIDAFSLDMHASRTANAHWSFGITYISDNSKIFALLKNPDADWQSFKKLDLYNVDWYMSYLRDKNKIRAESFYLDEMYFIHFGFLYKFDVHLHGLYHFQNNKCYMPFYNILDNGEKLYFPIHKAGVKFSLDLPRKKHKEFLKQYFFIQQKFSNWYYPCKIEFSDEIKMNDRISDVENRLRDQEIFSKQLRGLILNTRHRTVFGVFEYFIQKLHSKKE